MKKTLLSGGFLALSLLFAGNVQAQINQGGQPASFGKFFKQQNIVPVAHMPGFDLNELEAEDAINDHVETKPYRFGYNHFVNLGLYNSGTWTTLPNGDRVWQLGIKSTGALTINLAFNQFHLPKGAQLFMYNADHSHVIGAFTEVNNQEDGEFGADLVDGEEIYVEYLEPAAVAGQGTFNIFRVTHGYRSLKNYVMRGFGDAGSCQINVNCGLGIGWEDQVRSVACVIVGGAENCTGALVNNTANDGTPYFLSANHCGTTGTGTWVFRFNWNSPACSPTTNGPTTNTVSGATLRANSAGSDFALLQLNTTPPAGYGVYYAGWSRSTTPATSAMAIHHPSGDVKKISEAANPCVAATYGSAACWKVGQWTQGCTEPGSSGSPLFDQNHRIIGQLYGGPSACGVSAANMTDYYGNFGVSWTGGGTNSTRLSNWLDPSGTSPITLDGYDPNAVPPAFADDAGISAVNEPGAGYTSCNDEVIPKVVIRNFGSDNLTSATINYQLDGGAVQTLAWTGSLATGASQMVTLPAYTGLTIAAHTLTVSTSMPNGVADPNTANDQLVRTFNIIAASPTGTLAVLNGFTTFPGTGFSVENPDGGETWVQNTTVGGFGTSTNSATIDNFTDDFRGQSDYIHTAYLNLTSTTGPVQFKFDVAYARYNATYQDSLKVWVSSNCGPRTRIYNKGNTSLATAPDATGMTPFVPTSAQWRTETIDVSAYAGMDNVRFSFENKSGYGQALYIDNINIQSTTGTTELVLDNSIQLVPNPASTNVTVTLPLASEQYTIILTNGLGQQVYNQQVNGNATRADLALGTLKPGVYFVTIQNGTQKTVKKLVKQ